MKVFKGLHNLIKRVRYVLWDRRGTGDACLSADNPKQYRWLEKTVAKILEREEYIGTMVNCRGHIASFKSKKRKENPPEQWLG